MYLYTDLINSVKTSIMNWPWNQKYSCAGNLTAVKNVPRPNHVNTRHLFMRLDSTGEAVEETNMTDTILNSQDNFTSKGVMDMIPFMKFIQQHNFQPKLNSSITMGDLQGHLKRCGYFANNMDHHINLDHYFDTKEIVPGVIGKMACYGNGMEMIKNNFTAATQIYSTEVSMSGEENSNSNMISTAEMAMPATADTCDMTQSMIAMAVSSDSKGETPGCVSAQGSVGPGDTAALAVSPLLELCPSESLSPACDPATSLDAHVPDVSACQSESDQGAQLEESGIDINNIQGNDKSEVLKSSHLTNALANSNHREPSTSATNGNHVKKKKGRPSAKKRKRRKRQCASVQISQPKKIDSQSRHALPTVHKVDISLSPPENSPAWQTSISVRVQPGQSSGMECMGARGVNFLCRVTLESEDDGEWSDWDATSSDDESAAELLSSLQCLNPFSPFSMGSPCLTVPTTPVKSASTPEPQLANDISMCVVNQKWREVYSPNPCNTSPKKHQKNKVHFCEADPIVHTIIAWDFAYRSARKGPWEQIALDRCRFKTRIRDVERAIGHVLTPDHRQKVFRRLFS